MCIFKLIIRTYSTVTTRYSRYILLIPHGITVLTCLVFYVLALKISSIFDEFVPTVLTSPLTCGFMYLLCGFMYPIPWIYVPASMDISTDYSLGFIASTHTESGVGTHPYSGPINTDSYLTT
jgi:hypothetical protein